MVYEILISGIFSDPFYDFTNLLLSLLNNEDEITIQWFGEPGGSEIHIIRNKTQRHLLDIKISDFDYHLETKLISNRKELVSFEIKQTQFMTIGFYQLKKTYHLFREKNYAKDWKSEFPFALFDKLSKRVATDFPELL